MDGYGQYCPIARAAELFAERWTPLIIRNLLLGSHTFNDIHAGIPRISRSLLTQRLRSLERDGLVERRPGHHGRGSLYHLTPAGAELDPVCEALGVWGARWLDIASGHLDPLVVLWGMCRLADADRLSTRPVTVRIDLRDGPQQRFWLLFHRPNAEVCIRHPGFEEALVVTTDCEWLAKWHMGWITLQEGMERDLVLVEGRPELVRMLPEWVGLSRFAHVHPADPAAVEPPARTGTRAVARGSNPAS